MSSLLYQKLTPTSASEAQLAGLNSAKGSQTNPFVTENEINSFVSGVAVQRNGTFLSFDVEAVYGTTIIPEKGNISFNSFTPKLGLTQLLIHNNSIAPSFDSQFKLINGAYSAGVLNYIVLTYVDSTHIIYSIAQQI